MGWINFDDVLAQMQAFGLDVEAGDVVVGERRRCRHREGGREKRGWFQLYELPKNDGSGILIVGSFGAFFGAENLVQKVEIKKDQKQAMSKEQMDALRARIAEDKKRAEAAAKARAGEAAKAAEQAWRECQPIGESAYLTRKGVENFGGRFHTGGSFVIPMMDTAGRIHGLQRIFPEKRGDRDKDFWPVGLAKKSHFFQFGGIPDGVLLLGEGYATLASVHMAVRLPVAVAFDAGNLLPVALELHKKYPRAKIVICADDDYRTDGNPGVKHAEAAALAVGGTVVVPKFAAERPTDRKGPTDFNDLHLAEGLHVVKAQIEAHLAGNAIVSSRTPRGEIAKQGEGDGEFPAAVSVMSLNDAVERFVPIDDEQGEALFDNWTYTIVHRKKMTNLLEAGVRIDDVKKHPYWQSRGAYYLYQVGFDPAGTDSHIKLNTWRGWPMKPKRGSCARLKDLLRYLCSAEANGEVVYRWILARMAYALQNPGRKLPSAIIMHGPQGTGKSMFFRCIAKIFGDEHPTRNYSVILDQKALQDNFNADWENKMFVLCEEVVNGSEKWQLKNELKELVSGSTLRIRKVFRDGYHQKNRLFLVFLSNEFQPLPLDNDDRRHLVVWTPPKGSYEFYDEVREEIGNGGIEALYDELLHYDLSDFNPTAHPPMTGSKQRLIALSASSDIRFCQEWISGDLGLPVCPCLSTELYAAYLRWCRANGENRQRPSNQFFAAIQHQEGWEKKKARYYETEHSTKAEGNAPIVIPPFQANDDISKEHRSQSNDDPVWFGRGIRRFSQAVASHETRCSA